MQRPNLVHTIAFRCDARLTCAGGRLQGGETESAPKTEYTKTESAKEKPGVSRAVAS